VYLFFFLFSFQGGVMTAGTKTARSVPLPLAAAKKDQTPNAGFPFDFQDLCSLAMDQALGIEKESLVPVVGFNSRLLDLYQNAFCIAPVLSNLSDAAAQVFASCVELEMGLIALLAPHTLSRVSTVASSSGSSQDQPNEEELAYSMDIALGERFAAASRMDASNSSSQAQPNEEELAYSMDVVIGERFAAPSSEVASSPAITPSRKRRVGERFGNRYRGAGGRLTLSYGSRKAHG
jgi:hypothetical protein